MPSPDPSSPSTRPDDETGPTNLHLNFHTADNGTHPPTVSFPSIPAEDDPNRPTLTNLSAPSGPVDEFAPTLTSAGRNVRHREPDPTSPEMPALRGIPMVKGFDVDREIGRGGMGAVYKAREITLNRLVALKMILPERVPSAEELIRFRLEAEVAARVRHPNVVQVYESGSVENRPYLVMEWVEGGTLSDVIKQSRLLPPLIAAKLMAIIARAVHQCHVNGIVHRDLKPGNVLLAQSLVSNTKTNASVPTTGGAESIALRIKGETMTVVPKVTDFGLAKLTAGDMGLTETGRVMGTPEFMAPEQAAGRIREIGPPSDVHSLGVMLYQLIVGHTPFRGDNTYAVIKKVIEDEPKSLRAVSEVAKIPLDLETVCLKCLRKNPFDRYQTALDFANDLEAILTGRPISARRVGPVERAWKFTKRNPALTGLAAACFLSLFGGLAGVTWQWRKTVAERNRAIVAEDTAKKNEATAIRAKATSDTVNSFLVNDLIAAAAPDRALGRTVTVQNALDEASQKVEQAFLNEPAVEAGVRTALGMSYRKLGKPSLGIPHLRKSYETFRKEIGPAALETLHAGQELAESLDDAGDYPGAESLFDELSREAKKSYGEESDLTLEIAAKQGLSLQVHSQSDKALSLLLKTLAVYQRRGDPPSERIHKIENDLGLVYYFRQNYAEAERLTKLALAGREKEFTAFHPLTMESRNNLAAIYQAQMQNENAITLFDQVVVDSTTVRGANHVDTLSAINNLGRAYYKSKSYGIAEAKYRQAFELALASRDLGPTHPLTLTFQHNLGNAQFSNKQQGLGMLTVAEVVTKRKSVLEANHPETLAAELDLGRMAMLTRDFPKAIATLIPNVKARQNEPLLTRDETLIAASSLGTAVKFTNPITAELRSQVVPLLANIWNSRKAKGTEKTDAATTVAMQLAFIEVGDPKLVEVALDHAAEAYAARMTLFAENLEAKYTAAVEYHRFVVGLKKFAEAIESGEMVIRIVEAMPVEKQQPRLKFGWHLTGDAFIKANQPEKAEPLYRKALAYHESADPDPVELITSRYKLGQCLRMLKQFDASEPILVKAYEGLQTTDKLDAASKKLRTELVIRELIQLYTDWNKPEKVTEWQGKLKG